MRKAHDQHDATPPATPERNVTAYEYVYVPAAARFTYRLRAPQEPAASRHFDPTDVAHLKRILKLDRLRLRGPNGALDEFLLAATAQNIRKMAKLIPMPTLRPA